ncbi:chromosome segregation protein SMC [Vagococcus acidifermentans]|uniref:Chromosome partition protein Smc n=1 Tax=Vagococcus acidifermentans TaxID=564710 RepID=A0A430AUQ1_9ENTE|nr:chromosome segregation protein SMC [Vagococcus acidifermentans]RSU11784.1 chromosome segregation protein SMC [Vagococcus acidifermentans]
MYLKRIELSGFKSFADRTVIEFDDGLTAVVGPNGSGKSNITEAIRWVLGEQSAKSLRGGKMPDVIFSGSAARKPLNIAEVTLVLNNESHFLPLDFSEVSVTRRLNRNGDSDFFINKQSCRLKDIVDLFTDSGLGKESFSIISQGKVESIFNSKPEDRRGIFEEAAGVLKYKQRKHKAEQKLFETEDNLNRVQDIIYELESQLDPLSRQSEQAKKYMMLKEKLTEIDVGVTVAEVDAARAQWETTKETLAGLNQSIGVSKTQIASFEAELDMLRSRRASLNAELDDQQRQLLQATEAYEQAEGKRNVLTERSKHTAENVQGYQQTIAEAGEQLTAVQGELTQLIETIDGKNTEKIHLQKQVSELEKQLARVSKSAKEQLEEMRSEYVDVMQQQANANNDLKHLEKEYQQMVQRNDKDISRYDQLSAREEELLAEQQQLTETKDQKNQELADCRGQYQDKQQHLARLKQEAGFTEKQMYEALGILQQARARQHSYRELQENYAGFYQGVRSVLTQRQELGGIVGAVAELMQVPKELALAIETALGGAAQHIVTEDEASARRAIAYLKRQRLGRATFLPLTTIKPRKLPQSVMQQLAGCDGFLGVASEQVTFPGQVAQIMENLLGVTLLAQNLDTANQIARQVSFRYRVVSLEGDLIHPGGSMTGGATKKSGQGNLFMQANELEELTKQIAKMERAYQQKEVAVNGLKEAVQKTDVLLEELRRQGETAKEAEQELSHQLTRIASELEQVVKEKQASDYEKRELTRFLDAYHQQKGELTALQAALQERREQLDAAMSRTDETEAENAARKEAIQGQLADANAQVAVLSEQIGQLTTRRDEKEQQLADIENQRRLAEEQLTLLTTNQTTVVESREMLEQQMRQFSAAKQQVDEHILQVKASREETQERISEMDQLLMTENKTQQELMDRRTQAEVVKNRMEVTIDNGLTYLQEEYSLTFEAGQHLYPLTVAIDDGKATVRQLKKSIGQLGPVNTNAIEQYEQVKERYDFLMTQRDDLVAAKGELFDTMSEMDSIVAERFASMFQAIRAEFRQVFPNMFGGGHADLQLTDEADLLNTGIEIVAQPPGKKLQSLSLLSGGERALTAIALLFSIIQVSPVPFCVLDEVEAALDDANVVRFGKYLSEFEKDTQFIVITHRKGTMEASDVLYGVTMQESGVSKIVSVHLEDINERGDFQVAQS